MTLREKLLDAVIDGQLGNGLVVTRQAFIHHFKEVTESYTGVFLANCFEKKSETSGKCLLFLAWLVHRKNAGPILTLAMVIWRARIELTYGGMGGVYAIYFGMTHPFTLYPPEFPGT